MRLIPAEAGKFKQGQVYVRRKSSGVLTHCLDTRTDGGAWIDSSDGAPIPEDALLNGWLLVDPSDDPEPTPVAAEPKRELQVGDLVRIVGLPEGVHGWRGWRKEHIGKEFVVDSFVEVYDCKCAVPVRSEREVDTVVWQVPALELVSESQTASRDPGPKRDEFWEKCYLAALTGFCSASDQNVSAASIEKWSRDQADVCVAAMKARG